MLDEEEEYRFNRNANHVDGMDMDGMDSMDDMDDMGDLDDMELEEMAVNKKVAKKAAKSKEVYNTLKKEKDETKSAKIQVHIL